MCKTLFHTFDIIYQIMCFRQVGQLCNSVKWFRMQKKENPVIIILEHIERGFSHEYDTTKFYKCLKK